MPRYQDKITQEQVIAVQAGHPGYLMIEKGMVPFDEGDWIIDPNGEKHVMKEKEFTARFVSLEKPPEKKNWWEEPRYAYK
jgi:hypothetical protein